MLANYEPEEVVALLSCFVFQEKTDVEPVLTPHLEEGRDSLLAVAERIGEVQVRHRVAVPDVEKSLKFGLVEVVYEWAKGMVRRSLSHFSFLPLLSSSYLLLLQTPMRIADRMQPFEQIMMLTDVAEGTIVRVITRLDETCREVRDAARVIGDASLMKKMEEAQIRIKRDSKSLPRLFIVFFARGSGRFHHHHRSCSRILQRDQLFPSDLYRFIFRAWALECGILFFRTIFPSLFSTPAFLHPTLLRPSVVLFMC